MYTPSIVQNNVFKQLGDFLTLIIGCPIVRAMDNQVPMPKSGFICMTPVKITRLATDIKSYTDNHVTGDVQGETNHEFHSQFDIQIDIYGQLSGDWAETIKGLFRSSFGTYEFTNGIAPLHASDANQMPLTNAEAQYEQRWTMTLALQYNPIIQTPMQFADKLSAGIHALP
jgi:hypothetical protein